MVIITKQEAEAIRKKFPEACIAITNRQKKASKKTRYVEESPRVMYFLKLLRGEIKSRYDRNNNRRRNNNQRSGQIASTRKRDRR